MIGLDTNILVRYLVQDDPDQTKTALELMNSLSPGKPGFISLVVLAELVWVLDFSFQLSRSEIAKTLETVLRSKEVVIEHAEVAEQALRKFSNNNCDYADCLIERSAHRAGCDYVVTFDRKAAKAAGMRLLG